MEHITYVAKKGTACETTFKISKSVAIVCLNNFHQIYLITFDELF